MNRKADDKPARAKRSSRRRLAEWTSLGISLLLILGTTGYLVYQGLREEEPFVPVVVEPQLGSARQLGERYILPIKIRNAGGHTLRDLKIEIELQPPGSPQPQVQDFILDYLGERSEQTIYISLDRDPRTVPVRAAPAQYRLE